MVNLLRIWQPPDVDTSSKMVCEGEIDVIKCPRGQIVHIVFANYGVTKSAIQNRVKPFLSIIYICSSLSVYLETTLPREVKVDLFRNLYFVETC